MKNIVTAIMFCFVYQIAHADVLFIDLNLSYDEVETARNAAAARGERLVVVPELSQSDLQALIPLNKVMQSYLRDQAAINKKIAEVKKQIQVLDKRINEKKENKNALIEWEKKKSVLKKEEWRLAEQVSSTVSKALELQKKIEKISGKYKISQDSIAAKLQQISEEKRELSSVIISGHHGNEFFGTQMTNLDDQMIKKIFQPYPKLRKNLRSMYLWGCYTANVSAAEKWGNVFPNLALIAGFSGSAPTQEKVLNHAYLRNMMRDELPLILSGDVKKVQQGLLQVKGVAQSTASMIYCDTYYIDKNIADAINSGKICSTIKHYSSHERLTAAGFHEMHRETFDDIFYGKFTDVPDDTSDSNLRRYYTLLRNYSHCEIAKPYADKMPIILRLIFFHEICINFFKKYPTEAVKVNQILRGIGAPAAIEIPTRPSMPRQHFVLAINKLNDYVRRLSTQDKNKAALEKSARLLTKTLFELKCVPISWVEPATDEKFLASVSEQCLNE